MQYTLIESRSRDDWQLITAGITASSMAYNDTGHAETTRISKLTRTQKFMTMNVEQIGDTSVLVIAIRGSVTMDDWGLNFNSTPKLAPKVPDD